MEDRWARTRLLLGEDALHRLAQARVMVVGLGGVGSYAAEALARAGIGNLVLVDHDRVVMSNINRQLVALTSTLGQPKAEVMAKRVKDINPECNVEACAIRCSRETVNDLLKRDLDYVVDAIDSVPDKVCLIKECFFASIPIISSMGAGNRIDPTKFTVADISETHTCPLARRVRHELRRVNIYEGVRVVYSQAKPVLAATKSPVGSISFVPSTAGLLLAATVIKDLLTGIQKAD